MTAVHRATVAALVIGVAMGPARLAHADEPKPKPSMTLPAGALHVDVNLELEVTADTVGKPTSISPDVAYGLNDDLTLSVVHSTFAFSGFRGGAGKGLCVTGDTGGCVKPYNNVGAEGLYALTRGPLAIAANAGVHAISFDAGFYAVKLGAKLRYRVGALALISLPSVAIAVSKRDAMVPNKDAVFVPVVAMYRVSSELAVGLGSGIKGPIDGFGDAWKVSLGAIGTYAVSPALTIGASWVFGQAIGGADDPPDPAPPANGLRYRAAQLWASIHL